MIDELIRLNGLPYVLARSKDKDGKTQGRSWQETQMPISTQVRQRADVQPGPRGIDGLPSRFDEQIIRFDDWSQGVSGDMEGVQDALHYTVNAHGLVPGFLYPTIQPKTDEVTDAVGADPVKVLVFEGELFVVMGRYMYKYSNGTRSQDRDFGAGVYATDAVVFNDHILVCFGGTTNKVQSRDNAGSWSTASDAIYADHFEMVEDRLWRATVTNEVSNIGPTDDPLQIANWSTGIPVGDDDLAITDLSALGERLAVSKVNGLMLGDETALFPNVLPQLETVHDPLNGRNTLCKGATVFYPHANGMIKYYLGGAEEVGVQKVFPSGQPTDSLPGVHVTTTAVEGNNIWCASEHDGYPRARPTGFKSTANAGVAYTDLLANVIDANEATTSSLNSLDTVANSNWAVVGYSAPFYGIIWELSNPNLTASNATIEFWNGSAWTALDNAAAFTDRTTLSSLSSPQVQGSKTLRRSQFMEWRNSGLSSWATSSIDGTSAYWVRFSVSAAIDSGVAVSELWVMQEAPKVTVWRGRPGIQGDARYDSVVWEPFGTVTNMIYPGAILFCQDQYPHNRREQLVVAGRNYVASFYMPISAVEQEPQRLTATSYAVFPKHDAGMPATLKQFMSIKLNGRGVTSGRTVTVEYRLNDATSWTTAQSGITSLPATIALSSSSSDISGYKIQLRVSFNPWTNDAFLLPSIRDVEIVFRPRYVYHREFDFAIQIEDNQVHPQGGALLPPDKQLSNLEALVSAAPIVMIDPLRRAIDVTIWSADVKEITQFEKERPQMIVQIKAKAL